MRATDFDQNTGWAGNARVQAKLADLAQVTASTRYVNYGFGGIQQKISQRTRERTFGYDASLQIQLDKFIPGKTGIKIPMYMSYERSSLRPLFDPQDPDIRLEDKLENVFVTPEERQEYLEKVEGRNVTRSLNFTNVRKEKVKEDAKKHIYDVENLNATYSWSDNNQTNFQTADNFTERHNFGLGYTYSPAELVVKPFTNFKFLESPYLALIKDFNLSFLPASINVRGDLARSMNRREFRDPISLLGDGNPQYQKLFTFNRTYSLNWNLTQSLTVDYSSTANAVIDEPYGELSKAERDTVLQRVLTLGRMKTFNQNVNMNYRVPLNKLPLTDYLNLDAQYQVGYVWQAGALGQADTLGNSISNNRTRALNGKVDMVKLYDKVKLLKEINAPPKKRRPSATAKKEEEEEKKSSLLDNKGLVGTLRLLMALRSVNARYSLTENTFLPGYLPGISFFGFNEEFDTDLWPFLLGSQNKEWLKSLIANDHPDWFTANSNFANSLTQSRAEDLSFQGTIEPAKDFRLQLDFKKSNTNTYSEIFFQDEFGDFQTQFQARTSTYDITYFSLRTAFSRDDEENNSPVFQDFVSNRDLISARLGGFDRNSQEVLIPAFLAAYSGSDAQTVPLGAFPTVPKPNWRVDYSGLKNVEWIKDIFSQVTINHGYTSSYAVTGIQSVLDYPDTRIYDLSNRVEDVTPFDTRSGIAPYVISSVGIREAFSPLIGLKLRTQSRWDIQSDYKITRDIRLDLTGSQVSEQLGNNVSLSLGYTKAGMKMPFRWAGRTVTLKNDLTFRMAAGIQDNKTIQRKILQDGQAQEPGLHPLQMPP
ncbi:MAG: cell surface protein SprA [Cytophagales bacterium]|nr:cell surface protein SprA [Cytophagales bacterium]